MTTMAMRPFSVSPVSILALGIAALIVLPLIYVIYLALTADLAVWNRLLATRIPELLTNTGALALGTAAGPLLVGVSLAWIVTRLEFAGRRVWEWALVLPLALPSYVLAYIYTYLLGMGGPVEQAWQGLVGPEGQIFSPYSLAGPRKSTEGFLDDTV